MTAQSAIDVIAHSFGSARSTPSNELAAEFIVGNLALNGYAVVQLPNPDGTGAFPALVFGECEDVYARHGEVIVSGVDRFTPDGARQYGAALIAAAGRAEAAQ